MELHPVILAYAHAIAGGNNHVTPVIPMKFDNVIFVDEEASVDTFEALIYQSLLKPSELFGSCGSRAVCEVQMGVAAVGL